VHPPPERLPELSRLGVPASSEPESKSAQGPWWTSAGSPISDDSRPPCPSRAAILLHRRSRDRETLTSLKLGEGAQADEGVVAVGLFRNESLRINDSWLLIEHLLRPFSALGISERRTQDGELSESCRGGIGRNWVTLSHSIAPDYCVTFLGWVFASF
jgi:hypothetical protein